MRAEMAVEIVRFVDGHKPGWVEAQFLDTNGRCHRIIDKVPIFSSEVLDADTAYPQAGIVRCEILSTHRKK
jgi:hypothetical protein